MKICETNGNVYVYGADISLDDTFDCGQCFRWTKGENGAWTGVAGGRAVTMMQKDDEIVFFDTSKSDVETFWVGYLDLEHDYTRVAEPFADDEYLCAAAKFGKGIHILRQEPLEALISYIISSNNNISRIKKIVEAFCVIYGDEIEYRGMKYHAFPTLEQLSAVTVEGIAPIRAGFRDKYIFDAAQKLVSGEIDLDAVSAMTTDDARAQLMKIKGIGQKVADCVMLFGFARYEVFPKDVWIKRVMNDVYGDAFDEHRFGADAGIIQQYFYHYARNFMKNVDKP